MGLVGGRGVEGGMVVVSRRLRDPALDTLILWGTKVMFGEQPERTSVGLKETRIRTWRDE
jgi:hypothetical protein